MRSSARYCFTAALTAMALWTGAGQAADTPVPPGGPAVKETPSAREAELENRVKALEKRMQDLEAQLKQRDERDPMARFNERFGMRLPPEFGMDPWGGRRMMPPPDQWEDRLQPAQRPRLGLELAPISDELRDRFRNQVQSGTFVMNVVPGSPAEKAGVRQGDAITRFASTEVRSPRDLIDAVQKAPEGKHEMAVMREGQSLTLQVDLGGFIGDARGWNRGVGGDGWLRQEDAPALSNSRTQTEVKASALQLSDDLAEKLKLNADQRKKMSEVIARHQKLLNDEVSANLRGGDVLRLDVNSLVEKHASEIETELKDTLSAEQLAEWSQWRRANNSVMVHSFTQTEERQETSRRQNGNPNF